MRYRQHPAKRRIPALIPLARNRRGAVAAVVAVSATALVGMAALASEAGVWQIQSREIRTAADLAALAGANAIERGADVVAVATNAASRNGFVQGGNNGRTTVVVARPPTTGAYAGNSNAVEVTVRQTQNLGLSSLVIGTSPTVVSRAVGLSVVDTDACILALGGGLVLGGNSTLNARRCALGAQVPSSDTVGISIVGSARVRTTDLVTTGGCSGCTNSDVWTDDTRTVRPTVIAPRPNPIADPFASLQNWTPTPPATCTPVTFTNRVASLTPQSASGLTSCSTVTVGVNQTLNLAPGLYYLDQGASLDIRGTVTGTGVTIVMTNSQTTSNVGRVLINAQSTVNLTGPTDSLITGYPAAKGLVLYRDARASNNGSTNEVRLNGGANMQIVGSIYLPTSDVKVNGNSGANYSTCMAIVGYSLSFSGNGDTTVDVSGCAGITAVPVLRVGRLVE